jgi:hypothetical protein
VPFNVNATMAALIAVASFSGLTDRLSAVPASALGFRTMGVVCAILPGFGGDLLCASSGIKPPAYDGRGIVRMSRSGRLSIIESGNDILLALDGDLPRSPRPALQRDHSWSSGGYLCHMKNGTVSCLTHGHGFSLSRTSFKRI